MGPKEREVQRCLCLLKDAEKIGNVRMTWTNRISGLFYAQTNFP